MSDKLRSKVLALTCQNLGDMPAGKWNWWPRDGAVEFTIFGQLHPEHNLTVWLTNTTNTKKGAVLAALKAEATRIKDWPGITA